MGIRVQFHNNGKGKGMLYVAIKPMMGVNSGFIKPGQVVNLSEGSRHFDSVAVNKNFKTNLFVRQSNVDDGDLMPIRDVFKTFKVYNLAGDDEYVLSAMSELEALDIVLEVETGETIRSMGGFCEGDYSYGVGDYAVAKSKGEKV